MPKKLLPGLAAIACASCLCGFFPGCERKGGDAAFPIEGEILEDKDVSAIALGKAGVGVLAADEGASVQTASLSRHGVRMAREIVVDPGNPEADLEGAAWMDGWFYVTGSHGAAKKKGTYSDDRARVYRFQLGNADTAPARIEKASLAPLLARNETLAAYHKRPLQQKGLNIEGLAAKNGDLYFGLRSPNVGGDAFVLRVNAAALFANPGNAEGRLFKLPVGRGLGIRAMESSGDGFLLIAGNAGSEPSKTFPKAADYDPERESVLFHWDPETEKLRRLAALPDAGKGKAEGLLILPATPGRPEEALVLFDGISGAGPIRLPVPPAR